MEVLVVLRAICLFLKMICGILHFVSWGKKKEQCRMLQLIPVSSINCCNLYFKAFIARNLGIESPENLLLIVIYVKALKLTSFYFI